MTDMIKTVGVYLYIDGRFAFAFGPNQHEGKLGIARVGGHIEEGETVEQCARREVKEETNLEIDLLSAPVTYEMKSLDSEPSIIDCDLYHVRPIVRWGYNIMFFARAFAEPELSSETRGIILLTESEIVKLCKQETKYEQFIDWGGISSTAYEYSRDFILQPLGQMQFLARLIEKQPQFIHAVYK